MRVRALVLRVHFVVGIVTGVTLLALGLSGAALVFRPELEGRMGAGGAPGSSDLRPVQAPPASLDAVVESARRLHPGFVITDLWLPDHRIVAARVGMLDQSGGAVDVLIDPHTAQTLGSLWRERSPLQALRLLHTELYIGPRGAAVIGVLGLWLLVQGVTGAYLSWPLLRHPGSSLHIRWSRPWSVVGRDLHRALGAASLAFHLPMAATGALLGLSVVLSSPADERSTPPGLPASSLVSFETLARSVDSLSLGGRITAFHLSPDNRRVTVSLRMPGDPDRHGGSAVVLAASGARVLAVHDARHAGWAAKSLAVVRALHVGELGGTPVRLLYVLGGLASVALACSGYVLAVARPRRVRKARAASP
jgi:uncharacterized iron-regulated membrane protein